MEPPERLALLRFGSAADQGVLCETEGVLAAWFRRHGCAAAIVRPDHYVYAVASSEQELVTELRSLTGRII